MDDAAAKQTPAKPAAFSVPRWLADLTGVDGWTISHTHTRRGVEFVASYSAGEEAIGQVTLRTFPIASYASWELLADIGGHQERIVIPARTHIDW